MWELLGNKWPPQECVAHDSGLRTAFFRHEESSVKYARYFNGNLVDGLFVNPLFTLLENDPIQLNNGGQLLICKDSVDMFVGSAVVISFDQNNDMHKKIMSLGGANLFEERNGSIPTAIEDTSVFGSYEHKNVDFILLAGDPTNHNNGKAFYDSLSKTYEAAITFAQNFKYTSIGFDLLSGRRSKNGGDENIPAIIETAVAAIKKSTTSDSTITLVMLFTGGGTAVTPAASPQVVDDSDNHSIADSTRSDATNTSVGSRQSTRPGRGQTSRNLNIRRYDLTRSLHKHTFVDPETGKSITIQELVKNQPRYRKLVSAIANEARQQKEPPLIEQKVVVLRGEEGDILTCLDGHASVAYNILAGTEMYVKYVPESV